MSPKPQKPSSRRADPLPLELLGKDLKAGMTTYQRVTGPDENVRFTEDLRLETWEPSDGCRNGIHFRASGGKLVCYFLNGVVWAK